MHVFGFAMTFPDGVVGVGQSREVSSCDYVAVSTIESVLQLHKVSVTSSQENGS